MKKDDDHPDGAGGIAVVFWTAVALIFIILIPSREGASRSGKFYLVGLALTGMGWGVRQILAARRADKHKAQAGKNVGAEPEESANRSQPVGSEENRRSSTAGSGDGAGR